MVMPVLATALLTELGTATTRAAIPLLLEAASISVIARRTWQVRTGLGALLPGRQAVRRHVAFSRDAVEADAAGFELVEIYLVTGHHTAAINQLRQLLALPSTAASVWRLGSTPSSTPSVLKSEFVATASHELRAPLKSLAAALDRLHAMASGATTSAWQREIAAAREQVDRLRRLADDLLDLARLEAGRVELQRQPVDPSAVIRDRLARFETEAAAQAIRLAGDVPDTLPLVDIDRERIGRVLDELIGNRPARLRAGRPRARLGRHRGPVRPGLGGRRRPRDLDRGSGANLRQVRMAERPTTGG